MDSTISACIISLLSLVFISISSNANQTFDPLIQCLESNSIPHNLLYTPNTTSYSTFLQSSIQNERFNSTQAPKPIAIISPTLESQVSTVVKCCRSSKIEIRVRSGGHDYEGLSYVAYSVLFVILDMRNFNSVDINTADHTTWVQTGATVGELYYKIANKSMNLGFPAGLCPTLGIGGHFSGGGIGTIMRKYGLSADNIIDARLVDSKGELLCRESMGEDLFWAIRGGGCASFGVILSYKINLVPVPPKVTVFTKYANMSENNTLLKLVSKWQDITYRLDERLFIRHMIEVSTDVKGDRILQLSFQSMFLGEKEELLSILKEKFQELDLRESDSEEMTWVESTKYFAGYTNDEPLSILLDRKPQFHYSFKAKSDFLTNQIPNLGWKKIWDELLKSNETVIMILDPLGGKMDNISEFEIPFPHRKGSLYNIQYLVAWLDQEESIERDKPHLDWMKGFYKFMEPYVSRYPRGAYLNYRDLDLGSSLDGELNYFEDKAWGKKYFKGNFRRLALVKSEVDPENFFRNEQSIPQIY
ncbi:hypothetical protein LUZ60_017342 [Juncus effusus]|nr:hypothetical protein LUZ60_017342 [Juncus effusus]